MVVPLYHYLVLSAVLFCIGAVGAISRRNAIVIFMCVELMLNAVNLTFIAFARNMGDEAGHVFVFIVMTVAAAEAAVGLAIILGLFRIKGTINADEIRLLKW